MQLLDEIEAFLKATGMSATAFGTEALNDPAFVQDLRDGRDPKLSTADRIRTFIRDWKPPCDEPESAAA